MGVERATVRVVGRAQETARIDAFLRTVADRSSSLEIVGPPGSGKTALCDQSALRAAGLRVRVLRAQPAEAEQTFPFAALGDLLAEVDDSVLRALPDPQRHALEVALLRREPGPVGTEPRAVGTGLMAVLRAVAPVLVALDDAQWLDAASRAALRFALRRLDQRDRVGLLVARRTGTLDSWQSRYPDLHHESLQLGPLSSPALRRVIVDRVTGLDAWSVNRAVAESAGNPLHALELATALRDGPQVRPGEPVALTGDLGTLLLERVRKLPPPARDTLLTVALTAEPTTGLLGSLHDPDALTCLEWEQLVRTVRETVAVSHPLYAHAVRQAVSPDDVRRRHAQLSHLVDRPEEQARHQALAGTPPDAAAAAALERGAQHARARGALLTAAELLEQAAAWTPPEHEKEVRRRAVHAAELHQRVGDFDRARRLLAPWIENDPQARLLVAELAFYDGNLTAASHHYLAVLSGPDCERDVAALLGLGFVTSAQGDYVAAAGHATEAVAVAERLGHDGQLAQALAQRTMMDFLGGRGTDRLALARAIALEDRSLLSSPAHWPQSIGALIPAFERRHDDAEPLLEALVERVRVAGEESHLAWVLVWSSWSRVDAARFAEASALVEEALAVGRLVDDGWSSGWALSQLALVRAHQGDEVSTRRHLAEAQALRTESNLLPIWVAASSALLELSLDRPEAAWAACAPLVTVLEEHGVEEPKTCFFLADAIEAMVGVGLLDRAARLADALHDRAVELDRTWAVAAALRVRALICADRHDTATALASLEQATALHGSLSSPFDLARVLLTRGMVERRAGLRRASVRTLCEAEEAFDRLGARLWCERARQEREAVPIRRTTGPDVLTPTEHRVAALVAAGHTNKEIAARLFVSVKAVEATLTRVYRKRGVKSRAALVAELAKL